MKLFRIGPDWMTEEIYVAGQQEIERLNLIYVCLSFIEFCKGPQNSGAADRNTSDCGKILKFRGLFRQIERFLDDIQPSPPNPFAVLIFRVSWIEKMPKAVL